MSASAERREPIDIEEFERAPARPETAEPSRDPLADLARLVAGQGQPEPRIPSNPFSPTRPRANPAAGPRRICRISARRRRVPTCPTSAA